MSLDITVIVRTSGRPRCYLDRALESIRAQTLRPAQLILSDDMGVRAPLGEDGALLWLTRSPDERPNRSRALNRAIGHATSPWLAFLDDDDTWAPDFLARMSEAAAGSAGAGAFCCRTEARYEDEQDGVFTDLGAEPFNPGLSEITVAALVRRNLFTNHAALWRREVFSKTGGYREDLEVLEDWEFNVRACRLFQLCVVPLTLARYHQRPRLHGGGQAANSSRSQHDVVLARLTKEWRSAGLLPPDRGWHWLMNRLRGGRHRWARWRFAVRWERKS